MPPLSPVQQRLLDAIRQALALNGQVPTYAELRAACGLSSTSVVAHHLGRLEAVGLLQRAPRRARGLRVLAGPEDEQIVAIPLIGEIAAETPPPLVAVEPSDLEPIEVSRRLLPPQTDGLIALRVRGRGLVDALVDDGDLLILRPGIDCAEGETAAVWLRGDRQTAVARLYREADQLRLQPANITLAARRYDPNEVEVLGRVVSVVRRVA